MVMEQDDQDSVALQVRDWGKVDRRPVSSVLGARPAVPPVVSGWREFNVPPELASRLWHLAGRDPTGLFAILLSAFQIVTTRLGLCPLIGDGEALASLLVAEPMTSEGSSRGAGTTVRLSLPAGQTFRQSVDETRRQIDRDGGVASLVPGQAGALAEADMPAFAVAQNIHAVASWAEDHQSRPCAMVLSFQGVDGALSGILACDGVRIDEPCAMRIEACYLHFLGEVIADPEQPIVDLGLFSAAECDRIARLGIGRVVVRPPGLTVVRMLEAQAAALPNKRAIAGLLDLDNIYDPSTRKYIVESVTYGQLNGRANQIARALAAEGIGQGSVVGVAASHSIHRMEALFGVLKAGAAFLPIDGRLPAGLRDEVLAQAGVRIVVTDAEDRDPVTWPQGLALLNVRSPTVNAQSPDNPDAYAGPDDPCYVCFTSGTTSRMKGVSVLHRGLANYAEWRREALDFTEQSLTLQLVPFSADGFASNAYPTLAAGGTLVMVEDNRLSDATYILAVLERFPITTMSLVPASCEVWVRQAEAGHLRSLQHLVLAGESASDDLLRRLDAIAPGVPIGNEYGPTEATVGATFCPGITPGATCIIGRPIDNVRVMVLGRNNEPMPPDVAGEICIAGAGLARGYIADAVATARSFATGPQGEPIYRTGDRGSWSGEGQLKYLGRFDRQAKVRGHRVELGYLERRIGEILQAEVHVCLHRDTQAADPPDDMLVAYIETENSSAPPELRRLLETDLPDWMVPGLLMTVRSLPRDARGRVVASALPPVRAAKDDVPEVAMTETEQRVAGLFAQVLRLQAADVGPKANFFDLGGHSIALTRLAALIHSVCRVNIKMSQIFHSPTVESVARLVDENSRVVPERMARTLVKDVYPASPVQEQLFVARHRGGHPTAYNTTVFLDLGHSVDPERLGRALEQLVARHEALRTAFVAGGDHIDQRICPPMPVELEVVAVSRGLAQAALDRFVQPFSLGNPPLIRAVLLRVEGAADVVVVDSHHIVMDARSLAIVLGDLRALYRGEALTPQQYTYKDYSEWRRSPERSRHAQAAEDYWLERFSRAVPVLDLPVDRPRPRMLSMLGDLVSTTLDRRLSERLGRIARANDTTSSSLYLSAFVLLLARWTGQPEFTVGLSVSGRLRPELEDIVGNFASVVPLRCAPGDAISFRRLLLDLKDEAIQAYENQDYSLSRLVQRLGIRPDASRHAMFNTLFQYIRPEEGALPELMTRFPLAGGADLTVPENYVFELVLDIVETKAATTIKLGYCAALFERQTVKLLLQDLTGLLQQIGDDTDLSLAQVDLTVAASAAAPAMARAEDETGFTF